jgi:uncharacterized protein YjbI with pentapeptide repeats
MKSARGPRHPRSIQELGGVAMAKKTKGKRGKLAGKTVAFVGKFGYQDMFREDYEAFVVEDGGTVVDLASAVPDYLVAGEGRGGNPPAAVAAIQKKHPSVHVLDEEDFCRFLLPTAEELTAVLRAGERGHQYWDRLERLFRRANATIDLGGADLRGANLYRAQLASANLYGADLRKASAHYVEFGSLRGTRFDGADLSNAYFHDAADCSFRKANLFKAWLDAFNYKVCDFSGANLAQVSGEDCSLSGCTLEGANLSDGQLEKANFAKANLARADLSRAHCEKAKFNDANCERAVLFRADLRNASLVNADLRGADLRQAVLCGANLRGANVEGADFAGAVLTGAKLTGVDFSAAKNYQPPVARVAGPKLKELAQAAATGKGFKTSAEVELGKGEHATLQLHCSTYGKRRSVRGHSEYQRDDHQANDWIDAPTFEQGMLNLAERWPQAKLRLATIKASGSRSPRGQKLLDLATAAWAEAFGFEATAVEDLEQQKAAQQAELEKLRETMLKELHGGPAGVKKWNARSEHERKQIGPMHGLDLKGAKLAGVRLVDCDLQGSQFAGASLKKAILGGCQLQSTNFARADLNDAWMTMVHAEGASFEGAKLRGAAIHIAKLTNAIFRGADLTGANLSQSHLEGADFTDAKLDGAKLHHAYYDADTKFPPGFTPPEAMQWVGAPPTLVNAAPGSMDFGTFFEQLGDKVEEGRLSKALAMLKADRFQLFADVKVDALTGVVKSQSNADLVYSCRLAADGKFGCCTQNLNPCGGLRGALCKHLLVLVVGLTKAGQLDPATVDAWVNASKRQKPDLDKDAMSETFLRYKGAEAGEIDWRPTETIPEDYYAL